ncbi:F-box/FBD/LRR-repeat protein At1g13570 [Lactuca sativa]|uniref:F-box domain-containing protein n=1 Tax=Lactuca sativa TaxID=4236 RepID=A0A9R1WN68_LACSA|nr:F-box/FBD/LRR-repeat protein At1g13570 [Lactuca sativa]KAJ0225551.1 hypothetical protein LSAT_V11C100030060 [Lactuca sativa]
MTANYRRKFGRDRISNLPEHLIASIIERLPIQDAVSTCIISKKWRYIWTEMRELVFDNQFSNKFAKNEAFGRNGFIRIIKQVLTLSKGPILKFSKNGAFGSNEFISIINQVLTLHKGPILKFHLHIPNIFLDSFEEVDQLMLLLSRTGVKELILDSSNRCYELPSYVFSCLELTKLILYNCFFKPPLKFEGFLNLEELILRDIDFGANLCRTKINLPQLKNLSLAYCTNVYKFKIKATNLFRLAITACPDAILATMLSNSKVKRFCIDAQFLKTLTPENIPKWLQQPDNSLRYLWFRKFHLGDVDQLRGALCLLRNSPNLKTLGMYLEKKPRVNLGPASSILESLNCLDYKLYQLQNVVITSIEGSKPEMLFIKLLLSHSPSLEKVTIRPSGSSSVQERLDIAKDVMWFPRASPKAKIIYSNP